MNQEAQLTLKDLSENPNQKKDEVVETRKSLRKKKTLIQKLGEIGTVKQKKWWNSPGI